MNKGGGEEGKEERGRNKGDAKIQNINPKTKTNAPKSNSAQ